MHQWHTKSHNSPAMLKSKFYWWHYWNKRKQVGL